MVFARSFVVCVLLVCVTYACAAGVPDLLVAVYRGEAALGGELCCCGT